MSVSIRSTAGRLEIGEPQPLFALNLGTRGEIHLPVIPTTSPRTGSGFS